ncbi:hypothetical protein G6L37_07275 [Agrobacterium rubi]|nr:hypothetical protein [Agrobacterium rubi]NTF25168.1 hypothetical protein [Agrobacterium rubi]
MKRNVFGDAQPANFDELSDAMFEKEWEPQDCVVIVEHLEEEAPYGGWTAEIAGDNDVICTLGYASKESLINDLRACGFRDIDLR